MLAAGMNPTVKVTGIQEHGYQQAASRTTPGTM